ncbi:MAG TPA: hypothetical protein VGP31_17510 [Planosporangium sp.]|nr:hypothetical protein [Planosporangium sp.]
MRNQRHESRGRHEASRRTRRQPRRLLVAAIGLLLPVALLIGGRMAFANQNDAAAAEPNPNCTLIVPANPLSADGLATPYRLRATNQRQGDCREANRLQAAFVQSTVLDPATGQVSVYNPLVIDDGRQPAVPPVKPQLPANAVVGIWFGFNGTNLTLRDDQGSLAAGQCVNGLGKSVFGQFAHCNAPAFFQAANDAVAAGKLIVPPLGAATDGQNCPTTRDFSAVDQDQSDNLTSTYLVVGNATAQNTAATRAMLGGRGKVQVNGSDNLLVDEFIDKGLGCVPFKAPDLADEGAMTTALALNELQAAAGQQQPVALVPPNDPMTKVGDKMSIEKLNLYRAGVNMPPLDQAGDLPRTYCQNMIDIQQRRLRLDRDLFSRVTSPDPAAANNLFSFLANRLNGSFTNLGCGDLLHVNNPVTVTQKDGVAVDATFFGQGAPATANPTATKGNNNGKVNKNEGGNNNGKAGTVPGRPDGVKPSATATPNVSSAPAAPRPTAAPSATTTAPTATATRGAGAAPGTPAAPTSPAGQKTPPAPAPTAARTATKAPDARPDPNKAGDGAAPRNGKF